MKVKNASNGHFLSSKQAEDWADIPAFDNYGTFIARKDGKDIEASAHPLAYFPALNDKDGIRHPGFYVSATTKKGSLIEIYFTPEQIAAAMLGIEQSRSENEGGK